MSSEARLSNPVMNRPWPPVRLCEKKGVTPILLPPCPAAGNIVSVKLQI